MRVRVLVAALLGAVLLSAGCSPAERTRKFGIGYLSNYVVTMYSGGQAVRTWHTSGKVTSEGESDGYYFIDRDTNKLVEVAGDLVIEQE